MQHDHTGSNSTTDTNELLRENHNFTPTDPLGHLVPLWDENSIHRNELNCLTPSSLTGSRLELSDFVNTVCSCKAFDRKKKKLWMKEVNSFADFIPHLSFWASKAVVNGVLLVHGPLLPLVNEPFAWEGPHWFPFTACKHTLKHRCVDRFATPKHQTGNYVLVCIQLCLGFTRQSARVIERSRVAWQKLPLKVLLGSWHSSVRRTQM